MLSWLGAKTQPSIAIGKYNDHDKAPWQRYNNKHYEIVTNNKRPLTKQLKTLTQMYMNLIGRPKLRTADTETTDSLLVNKNNSSPILTPSIAFT